ncbi:unannotated protein [freshwater metagenome]|uniref:Unannotated protein n=1 Tax=freshwater metagenome TaxID=449393 RepID=A0A6J6ETH0_9ZZZZ
MQVARVGVEHRRLARQRRHDVRMRVPDVAHVVHAVEVVTTGVVHQPRARTAHDRQLRPVARAQRRTEVRASPLHQLLGGVGVRPRLRAEAQQQVGIGCDLAPHRHAARFTGTLEVAVGTGGGIGHEVGDDLHVHVRRPPAVHGVVAHEGDDVAGLHALTRRDRAERAPRQVAVQHPERTGVTGLVAQDHRGAVVEREVVVDHRLHRARQHRQQRCVVVDEQVDAEVHRAHLRRVGHELVARVAVAVLVVAADGDRRTCRVHLATHPRPVRDGVGPDVHARRPVGEAHHDPSGAAEVERQRRHRPARRAAEPLDDRVVLRHGGQPDGVAGDEVEEVGPHRHEPVQQPQRRRLADGEVLVVGELACSVRRDRHAHREPRGDEVEQHAQLVRVELTARLHPATEEPARGGDDVGHVEQRVGQRHGRLVRPPSEGGVAEVDEPADVSVGDEHVEVVRVLVQHLGGQPVEHGQHTLRVPVERPLHDVPVGRIGDVGEPGPHGLRVVEVPQEPRPVRRRVPEPAQSRRQRAHQAAELVLQLGGARNGGERHAGQMAHHPHPVPVDGGGREPVSRGHDPRHRQRRRHRLEVAQQGQLQVERTGVLGEVRHLQHVLGVARGEPGVLVALAVERLHHPVETEALARDRDELIGHVRRRRLPEEVVRVGGVGPGGHPPEPTATVVRVSGR